MKVGKMLILYNDDNIKIMNHLIKIDKKFDLIYCDMIYENMEFSWVNLCADLLKSTGILQIQTDWHTVSEVDVYTKSLGLNPINHSVWKNEWGNHPRNKFHQCYDDILIYSKSKEYKFYSDKIQVPKATAKTKLNPSGRETKTATAWIDDICLTTTSLERVKKSDGHLIKWQKPIKLFYRICSPFLDEGDDVLDPFMGSGSLGVFCLENNLNYIGIELDKETFDLANARINWRQE